MIWLSLAAVVVVIWVCWVASYNHREGGDAPLQKLIAREQDRLRRELLEAETRLQSRT